MLGSLTRQDPVTTPIMAHLTRLIIVGTGEGGER